MQYAPNPDHDRLARHIRAARTINGLSRQDVAAALGVSAFTIGRWERSDYTRPITAPMIDAIARACGIPDRWREDGFLSLEAQPEPEPEP